MNSFADELKYSHSYSDVRALRSLTNNCHNEITIILKPKLLLIKNPILCTNHSRPPNTLYPQKKVSFTRFQKTHIYQSEIKTTH